MKKWPLLTSAAFSLLSVTSALAQETSPSDAEDDAFVLNSVIVTSTKRETNLADTPLTVSVIDGASIAERGIFEITDLFNEVPGLGQNTSPGELPAIKIRGIGTTNAAQTLEQSVGLFLDGVYKPRARQYRDALFDVERVEVIKGSQGVVFGKNTTVGAISITARKPGDEFGGELTGSYETEFDSYTIQGGVDLPASDTFKLRFSGLVSELGGFVENGLIGETDGTQERWTARAVAEFEPNDRFTATLLAQHSDQETEGSHFQIVDDFDQGLPFLDDTPYQRLVDGQSNIGGTIIPADGDTQDSTDIALTLNYELNDSTTLTSITSYSEFDYENTLDIFLFPPLPGLAGFLRFQEEFDQLTQEVRLDYQGERTRVLAGGFYQTQNLGFTANVGLDFATPATVPSPLDLGGGFVVDLAGFNVGGNFQSLLDQDLTNYSGFIQVAHDFTDRFSIEAGVRIADEEKTGGYFRQTFFNDNLGLTPLVIPDSFFIPVSDPTRASITIGPLTTPEVPFFSQTIDDTSVDGSITLSYDLTDDWLGHLSLSQGTKSGAFNNQIQTGLADLGFEIEPEVARTIELGLKGTFANGRGYLALAAFHTDIEDFQEGFFDANIPPAGALIASNVDARTQGFEAEGRFALTPSTTVNGAIAYLDAENTDNNSELSVSPEFTTSWGIDYAGSLSPSFDLQLGATAITNSGFLHQPVLVGTDMSIPTNQPIESGSFALFDVYAGVTHAGSGVTARLDVRNLSDEEYTTFASPGIIIPAIQGSYNRPRTFRVSLSVPF